MSRGKIMIVEDEAVTSLALEDSVTTLGYEVVATVASGEEAITVARQNPLDLVLMDIRLRGVVDGIGAAEKIRKEVDVPCIFLTAYSDEETLRRAKITQPYGYIVKPYNERELRAAIDIAIHNNAIERQRKAAEDALLARERTLQEIIDQSPAIIYLKDAEGRYTLVNRRFETVHNVFRADVRGHEMPTRGPLAREAFARADEMALKAAEPLEAVETLEHDEGPHDYLSLRFPLRRPDGSVLGVCGILTDLTELVERAQGLRASRSQPPKVAMPEDEGPVPESPAAAEELRTAAAAIQQLAQGSLRGGAAPIGAQAEKILSEIQANAARLEALAKERATSAEPGASRKPRS